MLDKFGLGRARTYVPANSTGPKGVRPILVDTSVIIDGRVADIAAAGFVRGELLVPRFVLAELQNIADSEDALRRGRGRRGLEVLNALRQTPDVTVTVTEEDAPDIKEVDAKLVTLARRLGADLLTTDFNLNRVAQFEGVRVLNINELSNAIRPVVIPGEAMGVKVVQKGKERGQGVGYLPDGTMIVVDDGDRLIGQEVMVEVTRVFQTVAGKMIFASPKNGTKTMVQPPALADITPPPIPTAPLEPLPVPASPPTPSTPPTPSAPPPGPSGRGGRRHRRGRGSNPAPSQPQSQPQDQNRSASNSSNRGRGRRSPSQRLEDSLIARVDAQRPSGN